MILTNFDHQKSILIAEYISEVNLKEIVDYINATKENKSYPRILKILSDATSAKFNVEPNDLPMIVKANNESLQEYDYIIDAIILNEPQNTALSILYQEMSRSRKYIFQVFSTTEAAESWLISNVL